MIQRSTNWSSSLVAAVFLLTIASANAAQAQYSYTTVDVPGAAWTRAQGINDSGQIVGGYLDQNGVEHGFLLSNGNYTTIDCPSPYTTNAVATGINNSGQIVGICIAPGGVNGFYGAARSFVVTAGVLTLLPDAPGSYGGASTAAYGIDDSGQIVGWYADGCLCNGHGFTYQNGAFTTLDAPGYGSTFVYGINAAGGMVGTAQSIFGGSPGHAFVFSGGIYTFGDPPASIGTEADGINVSGDIVGSYWDSANVQHGFVRIGATFTNLAVPGATNTSPHGINTSGVIVGEAGSHGFVATPPIDTTPPVLFVPPPMTVAATGTSGAIVTFAVTATDPDDAAGPVTCSPASGSTFAVGATTVTCTSTDTHGNAATASFSVTVQYGVCTLYNTSQAFKSGSTIPIKLQLCTAAGTNISSAGIMLTATSVVYVSSSVSSSVQDAGNANPDANFRYDATLGASGGYIFNLQTKGLASGTYALKFNVTGDPSPHSTPFQVK